MCSVHSILFVYMHAQLPFIIIFLLDCLYLPGIRRAYKQNANTFIFCSLYLCLFGFMHRPDTCISHAMPAKNNIQLIDIYCRHAYWRQIILKINAWSIVYLSFISWNRRTPATILFLIVGWFIWSSVDNCKFFCIYSFFYACRMNFME